MKQLTTITKLCLATLILSLAIAAPGRAAEEDPGAGTDPRDFAPKFMPYYRYTELENKVEIQEAVLFGLIAISPKIALTYEIPVAKNMNIKDTSAFKRGELPTLPPGLDNTFNGDGEATGVGDMNIRLLFRLGSFLGGDWLTGAQLDFPTATENEFASKQFKIGPNLTWVYDLGFWPGPGAFFAGMNFYFFDVFGEPEKADTRLYVGRWFFMLPLVPPDKPVIGGIYLLPEMQPVYDFERDHFSFWIAPEIGKMLAPGRIIYAKPGWGISPDGDEGDRKFTFEVGVRFFM
jgi:hypothetical protein